MLIYCFGIKEFKNPKTLPIYLLLPLFHLPNRPPHGPGTFNGGSYTSAAQEPCPLVSSVSCIGCIQIQIPFLYVHCIMNMMYIYTHYIRNQITYRCIVPEGLVLYTRIKSRNMSWISKDIYMISIMYSHCWNMLVPTQHLHNGATEGTGHWLPSGNSHVSQIRQV